MAGTERPIVEEMAAIIAMLDFIKVSLQDLVVRVHELEKRVGDPAPDTPTPPRRTH
jgi:hypothetical protein